MSDTKTMHLPRLVSGRDFADEMVDAFAAGSGPLTDVQVVVDASNLLSGTASFAAQLVRRILLDGAAAEMVLVGAPSQFAQDATAAASDLDVTARFDLASSLAAAGT